MADGGAAEQQAAPRGPFLREYVPQGPFRHTSARTASVLFYRNGGYSVVTLSRVEHHGKRAMARPHTVCEIALGTFTAGLEMELPAAGGASFFTAEVDIQWSVTDPYLAATEVVEDIAERLTAPTLERLREASSQYRVAQSEQAERQLIAYCADGRWDDLGADIGLKVRLYVRLRTDEGVIDRETALRQQQTSAELTRLRQEAFRQMLRGGQLEQLSFMLADRPDEARDFMETIRQEGRRDDKERIDRVLQLIESGRVHSVELERQALDELNRGPYQVEGPLGSAPARRDTPALEPAPDDTFTPDWVADEPPSRDGGESIWAEDARPEAPAWPEDPPSSRSREDEPPPRRSRSRDDAWSWAEED